MRRHAPGAEEDELLRTGASARRVGPREGGIASGRGLSTDVATREKEEEKQGRNRGGREEEGGEAWHRREAVQGENKEAPDHAVATPRRRV